jgi:hypothetical protein
VFSKPIEIREYIDSLPALFWLSSYVASLHLAAAPQSGAKDQFYCTDDYITFNINCEAQGLSKKLKKIAKEPKLMRGRFECKFSTF